MHGKEEHAIDPSDENAIRSAHHWAIDLFNNGYYWEAHEAWEAVWHAFGRAGPRADFVKGLIKSSAAGVKAREGNTTGIERHMRRALELFNLAGDDSETDWLKEFGFEPKWLISQCEMPHVDTSEENVRRVMPFCVLVEA